MFPETECAYSLVEKSEIRPADVIPSADLDVSVAFDNQDRYVDTQSGKDSIHDTVGISIQDIPDEPGADLHLIRPMFADEIMLEMTASLMITMRLHPFLH